MRLAHIIVVPCGATESALKQTLDVLLDHDLPHESLSVDALIPYLGLSTKPALAIVQASRLSVDVVETLRHLTVSSIPAMTLLEEATEEQEMTLLHTGAWEVLNLATTSDRRLRTRIATFYRNMTTLTATPTAETYTVGNLLVDADRRSADVVGTSIDLSKVEFDLLLTLLRSPAGMCTREELTSVLTDGASPDGRSLEVNMSRLRVKIESAGGPRLGESVRGVGYRLTA
ncbi:winged helix-turn-helix domain-containing protein [Ornithinicoccus hortensis]|uniref:Two-component system response regulator ResD n=1 Tax=Ornithinicoccus hortensis TaxID=82346 RepID=A0A542YLL0_9MICO|nr:winged helix-turn-helix domain-containing protein [Ornithinicoccus hortensis]TQL48990.1 two-component system response regulator ResD [Ornithinicoccus hortensis]